MILSPDPRKLLGCFVLTLLALAVSAEAAPSRPSSAKAPGLRQAGGSPPEAVASATPVPKAPLRRGPMIDPDGR